MFRSARMFLNGRYRITRASYQRTHDQLMAMVAALVAVAIGMFGVNVFLPIWINHVVAVPLAYMLLVSLTSWRATIAALSAGAGVAFLADGDVTKGSLDGLKVLAKLISGLVFMVFFFAIWLGNVEYAPAPSTFAPMALIIVALAAGFGMTSNQTLRKMMIAGAIVVFAWNGLKLYQATEAAKPADSPKPTASTPATGGNTAPVATAPQGVGAQKPVATQRAGVAAWADRKADDQIPLNAWSDEVEVPPGCGVKFSLGEGDQVEYRFNNKKWESYKIGTSPNMSSFRYLLTKEGEMARPYTLNC